MRFSNNTHLLRITQLRHTETRSHTPLSNNTGLRNTQLLRITQLKDTEIRRHMRFSSRTKLALQTRLALYTKLMLRTNLPRKPMDPGRRIGKAVSSREILGSK